MRPDDKEDMEIDDEQAGLAKGIEPTPGGLTHWIAEQYQGDDRFETIEVEEPGPLEEEASRVKFICDDDTHFMVAVLADDALVRVGLATESKKLVAAIEAAAEEAGGVLTDLLSDSMDTEEDLEHEVEHFHDDVDYFCSDIIYQTEEDLSSQILRDEVIFYLDGFMSAFYEFALEEED